MHPILIDCDPGLDDAIAIALAHSSSDLDLTAVSTVAANAPIEVVTANAHAVLDQLDCPAPLFQGAAHPLKIAARHSTDLWGGDGKLPIAMPKRPAPVLYHGAFKTLVAQAETVCAIGSLTNIAHMIEEKVSIARLAVMGGALGRGNATPYAELNIWADPHAADIVFSSDIPAVVAPLDLTRTLIVSPEMVHRLAASKTRSARLCANLLPLAGRSGHPSAIHDAAVIGYLLWPSLFTAERGTLSVVTEGEQQGRTYFTREPGGPHQILTQAHGDLVLKNMINRLRGEI